MEDQYYTDRIIEAIPFTLIVPNFPSSSSSLQIFKWNETLEGFREINVISYIMTQAGNILKDTFYKERLLQSHQNTLYQTYVPDPEESKELTAQESQLDMALHLSEFQATACNTTYAFINFTCTHKKLKAIRPISAYKFLQKVDLSYNSLKGLHSLSGLKHLTEIRAVNNQLTSVLDMKDPPLHLDTADLSSNLIVSIPSLERHAYLRVLKLRGNKIGAITGLNKNQKLQILDLSENVIDQIKNLDGLALTELYLSSNQIENVKGLGKLDQLRLLDLSVNKISQLNGLINLLALRTLKLAKNQIKHIRQIGYLQNLMYLSSLDLCFNPVQERKYYRLQAIYKLPMLELLDGSPSSGKEVVKAEDLYGLDVEEKFNIFKKTLPEEQFVDRRIHKSELIDNETDSEGGNNEFVDSYNEEGKRTHSNGSKNSKGFYTSKRSLLSKNSKHSKRSTLSKP